LKDIARIQIHQLCARLADQELGLEVSDTALDRLAELGFDPVYGARPLKRAVQRELENPLAQGILSGQFKAGDNIAIDLERESFSFRIQVATESQVA
jgi:ATP-dependent Clp protease ATP-binding subunit ClpB